ncbi:unnamed protein product [Citrullus colocynthis]|uniref:Uncharacterized protein n=1 Tax=Citrullus colocynthis TaxID=252529 RepID=A0ABP0YDE4_9ROSI
MRMLVIGLDSHGHVHHMLHSTQLRGSRGLAGPGLYHGLHFVGLATLLSFILQHRDAVAVAQCVTRVLN